MCSKYATNAFVAEPRVGRAVYAKRNLKIEPTVVSEYSVLICIAL